MATDADGQVFRDLYPKLWAYAAAICDAATDPDDLVQEALAATLRSHRLTSLEYPMAYLRRAVLSAAIGEQRKATTRRRGTQRLRSAGSAEPHYPSDLSDLDHLDPRDRAILYLVAVEGCTYAEVEELTGEAAQNAKLRASRARARLRSTLAAEATEAADTTTARPDDGPTEETSR